MKLVKFISKAPSFLFFFRLTPVEFCAHKIPQQICIQEKDYEHVNPCDPASNVESWEEVSLRGFGRTPVEPCHAA